MTSKKETIITQTYDLLKYTIPVLNKFPKSQKFVLGDTIQTKISNLLELYIKAYYTPNSQKKPLLEDANITLEILRHYFRLAFDLGLYNSKRYHDFAKKLNEIGKMTGGWIKTLKN